MNRQVVLQLQQDRIEVPLIDVDRARGAIRVTRDRSPHVAVAGHQAGVGIEHFHQLLQVVWQQLVIVVQKNRVAATGSLQQRICSSAAVKLESGLDEEGDLSRQRRAQGCQGLAAGIDNHELPIIERLRSDRSNRCGKAGAVSGADEHGNSRATRQQAAIVWRILGGHCLKKRPPGPNLEARKSDMKFMRGRSSIARQYIVRDSALACRGRRV